jgi:transposase
MKNSQDEIVRVKQPARRQICMQMMSLDQMLPENHLARTVCAYVDRLDTSDLYRDIVVTAHQAGRTATNPDVMLSLWLLATLEGIGSARELARRCDRDMAYMWICGEVSVNHRCLSEFRVNSGEFLDGLLTDTVTAMIHSNVVSYDTVAQDGMRVRASAGTSSFRRAPTLEKLKTEVKAFVDQLSGNDDDDSPGDGQGVKAANQQERLTRIEDALNQMEDLSERREKRKKGDGEQTRVSTTDPDARNMKMANGGFNPAFNVQFASDMNSRIIMGVSVTNEGTDGNQLPLMVDQLKTRYQRVPKTTVTDSAYATKSSVTQATQQGVTPVSSIPRSDQLKAHGKDPNQRQKGDSDEYESFRQRMLKQENIQLCKQRPSVAEFANADCRNRGLQQFNVRGLAKVKVIALWHAICFNLRRQLCLGVNLT